MATIMKMTMSMIMIMIMTMTMLAMIMKKKKTLMPMIVGGFLTIGHLHFLVVLPTGAVV